MSAYPPPNSTDAGPGRAEYEPFRPPPAAGVRDDRATLVPTPSPHDARAALVRTPSPTPSERRALADDGRLRTSVRRLADFRTLFSRENWSACCCEEERRRD
jgi:hypothetical protein